MLLTLAKNLKRKMDLSVIALSNQRKTLWLFSSDKKTLFVCISENEHRYVWKENIILKSDESVKTRIVDIKKDYNHISIPQWIEDMTHEFELKILKEEHLESKNLNKEYSIVTGILKISSKTQWGINSKGLRKYSFIPLYSRGNYPMYIVASKLKPNSLDVYVRVEINRWLKKDKHPTANLVEVLGNINEIDKFEDTIVLASGIIPRTRNTSYREFLKSKSDLYIIDEFKKYDEDWTSIDTISIDPEGSKDIDDALSYNFINESEFEIAVHIASPTIFFQTDSKVENISKLQTSSIYSMNKTIHLLPENISTDKASLLEGQERLCLSVIWSNKKHYRIVRTKIRNKLATSYEKVDVSDENSITYKIYNGMLNIFDETISADTHKIVEFAMIQANKVVAEFLVNNLEDKAILRKTMGKSAYYLPFNKNINNNHKNLNLNLYTHFTSPIRRYADQIVHRMIYSILNSKSEEIQEVPYIHMNNIHVLSKIIESELKWLELIKNNCKLIQGTIIDTQDEFAVIEMNDKNYFIRMYSEDVKDLISIQKIKSEDTTDVSEIEIIYNDKNKMRFKLNQKIEIKLFWISELGIKGIKFEWIQPNISEFINSI